ncbi:hypothetical protein J7K74_01875, partial [Candidatus Woesearchaeota archaeon]|nr:hypothetical protein [Candidatus Woesearchaeota archaeon]
LTRQEEFELMKVILDKFLWTGIIIMLFGIYRIIFGLGALGYNIIVVVVGAVIMVLFNWLLVREFEYAK